ncbi:unnamed protein product [marine sediment metagenome]|uniref:Homeodomain phBC6A51-type domain-containing protein n=1 Tax=marine sediment metagenome TaxID=412755 RepID=X1MHA5_9ZZZZ
MFDEIKQPKRKNFLEAYVKTGSVKKACEVADIDRVTPWRWRKEDEEYARAFEVAGEIYHGNYLDELEQELKKRSLEGTDKMSTVALFFALKAEAPTKYREKQAVPMVMGDIIIKMAIPPYDENLRLKEADVIEGEARELPIA